MSLWSPVKNLQQKLEQAKAQPPVAIEPLPMIAESVVQACEKCVAEVEQKMVDRLGVAEPEDREEIEKSQATLALRKKRWLQVKTKDPQTANRALEELMESASDIDREMKQSRSTNDAQKSKAVYLELLALLTPMQYACRNNDLDTIRRTWCDFEQKLNDCASELNASQLATALHWRLHGYESLEGWSRQGSTDPKEIAGKIAAIQWWQAGVQKHMAELAHWRPLLVMDSDGGPYFWGDAGWAIILADQRQVAEAKLHRLGIAVDVS